MNLGEPAISLRGPVSERKARRRRPMRLSSERGDETETREEAYGDPTPQNVNSRSKVKAALVVRSARGLFKCF